MVWGVLGCLPGTAGEKEQGRPQSVSAVAMINGCEITGEIRQAGPELIHGSLSPLRSVIKMTNPSGKTQNLSFFCQVISQDSKSPKNVFIFKEGTFEMTLESSRDTK